MNWWNERNLSFIAQKSRTGALDMGHMRMLLRRFACADGRMVQIHTGAAGAFGRAMELFGLADEISRVDAAVETSTPADRRGPADPARPAAAAVRQQAGRRVAAPVLGARGGLPAGAATRDGRSTTTRSATPASCAGSTIPSSGPIEVVGPVIELLEEPRRGRRSGAARPTPTVTRLRAAGWRSPGLEPTVAPRPLVHPLDGVRIVELSIWFAVARTATGC